MRTIWWAGAIALFALFACKKQPGEAGIADVKAAFGKEGWKLDGFSAQDPSRFSAQKCLAGSIEGLDAVVCEFGSAEAVHRGKAATEAWVAQAVNGTALENGRTTLGLADRNRVDPNGKLIHRITMAYRAIK